MERAVQVKCEPSDATDVLTCTPHQPEPTESGPEAVSIKTEMASSPSPDPVQPQEQQEQQEPDALEQWAAKTSPEILEHGVRLGMQVLETIKFPLAAAASMPTCSSTQASTWLDTIAQLESRAQPFKAIVGVVGNTGAGKSSVINALLDEERLLPTNCLRACTASPTEISYNPSDDPDELFRAEIEFIAAEDWIKELATLFTDLLDDGKMSRDCNNPETEAGIAYAKIKSVYPSKTNHMIAETSPERLANEPAVRGVLGSVKKLRSSTASGLYHGLQRYVDSKEKDYHLKKDVAMEYWPLIKVVRIYTKADALSTGAVIVDLPGVQDSNAARAAVAQQYMKACTGLWIVAPINRAVDDKTAKSLLGDSFKRQLKYDGIYSAVTFICSKTDDISVTEAAESLNLESAVSDSWAKIDDLRRRISALRRQLASGREEKADLVDRLDGLDGRWEIWDELSQKHADGKTVYPPSENAKKRKRGAVSSRSRKNRVSSDFDDSDSDSASESASDKENQPENEDREPLSGDQIREMLGDLKAQRKEIRHMRKEIDAKLAGIRDELTPLQSEEGRLLATVKAVCIQGRNGYSKGAIQRDFAMGIKELDQENAVEEDEDAFDPEEDIRDYDEVARSLPVFCVSSRAYQKMRGRLEKDDFNDDGFRNVNETEVPQLQQHAKKLTEAGRAAASRQFLNGLSQLINSMKMWASDVEPQSDMSHGGKEKEETFLRMQLSNLDEALAKAIDDCLAMIRGALSECIYESFDSATSRAAAAAVPTAAAWGARRADGGLCWATYKATCRRSGVYSGASGARDFNAELLEPITKQLANGWERAFLRRLPAALEAFAVDARLLLEDFHRDVVQHSEQRGARNHGGIGMLGQQLRTHVARLREIPGMLRAVIQDLQREASRGFQPVVTAEMEPAYDGCVREKGPGSFARMKTRMADHVETQRHGMFPRATESVRAELQVLCERVEQGLRAQVLDIYGLLARDYLAVLVGAAGPGAAEELPGLPGPEGLLRAEMLPILRDAGRWFADALGCVGDHPLKDESPVQGLSPCAGDDGNEADGDDDIDGLAAAQLHEEFEAGVCGRDSVGTTTLESAV